LVTPFSANLQTKERKAVVIPLPISMHTGQIILLAKMFMQDLQFYDFKDGAPLFTWRTKSEASK